MFTSLCLARKAVTKPNIGDDFLFQNKVYQVKNKYLNNEIQTLVYTYGLSVVWNLGYSYAFLFLFSWVFKYFWFEVLLLK
jgi:hypothetical protein